MDSGIEKTLLSFDSKMYSITYWFVSKDGETLSKLIYFPSHVFWQWICSNLLQGYQSNSFQYRIIGGFAPKYFWGLLLLTWCDMIIRIICYGPSCFSKHRATYGKQDTDFDSNTSSFSQYFKPFLATLYSTHSFPRLIFKVVCCSLIRL